MSRWQLSYTRAIIDVPCYSSKTGIFRLADTITREFPTAPDPVTHETIHPSVLNQDTILPQLKETLAAHPELVAKLLPLEDEVKANWHFVPTIVGHPSAPNDKGNKTAKTGNVDRRRSFLSRTLGSIMRRARSDSGAKSATILSLQDASDSDIQKKVSVSEESSFGALLREFAERA